MNDVDASKPFNIWERCCLKILAFIMPGGDENMVKVSWKQAGVLLAINLIWLTTFTQAIEALK